MPVIRLSERQWARYHRGLAGEVTRRLAERRERLILDHLPMAARIARSVAHLFAQHLDIRDLEQAGCLGLVQAADRYRSEDGPFTRFAYFRVRGAIIDQQKRRAYREELHYSVDEWLEHDNEGEASSRDTFLQGQIGRYLRDRGPLPDDLAGRRQRVTRLRRALDLLPDDEREIAIRALKGELAAQIAATFGHSPNWARVRLNAARVKLAARLREAA